MRSVTRPFASRNGVALGSILAFMLAGCVSTRNDPSFNPYSGPDNSSSVMRTADHVVDTAERWFADLDVRLERAAY